MLKTSFCFRRGQEIIAVACAGIQFPTKFRPDGLRLTLGFLAMVNLLFVLPAFADSRAVHTGNTLQTPYLNWMRWLPDSTPLSIISNPGTHDTMSLYGGPSTETQSMPLREQLRAGIRNLDIRARHILDRYAIHHGILYQNATFGDVLLACNQFLSENPSETILLWLSDAGVPGPFQNSRAYWDTFRWYRDESGVGERIYRPNNIVTQDLLLSQVRGKIVIISGKNVEGDYCSRCGINADTIDENESGPVATAFNMPAKWEAIVEQALVTDAGAVGTIYENSSTGSSGGVYPIDVANGLLGYEGMNVRYLRYLFTGNQRRTTGLFGMDFPGAGMISGIIAHNMKLATNVSAFASDFTKVVKDISYSTTHEGIDGSRDHAIQLRSFLRHILPDQHWSVLVSRIPGDDSWGVALEPDGLYAQSDVIDGFTHVAVSSRSLDPSFASLDLAGYWTANALVPLSGDASARAKGAQMLLKARFPQARWNVAVKRVPFDVGNWATELDAAVSATVIVPDEAFAYSYTAWATSGTNRPPVAHPGGPYEVDEGSPVTFDASLSTDSTGDVLQYRWDFNGGGRWDTQYSYDPTITHTYLDDSTPQVWLGVFDGVSSATEKVTVIVRNVAPRIDVPVAIALGNDPTLARQFTIVDPGADTWAVNVSYGDGTPRSTLNLAERNFTLNHQFPAFGYFEVSMDVRDDDGARTETRFRVVSGTPALDIQRLGADLVRLSWSNHPAPFRLERSTQPSGPTWQPVPGVPTLMNGWKQIDLDSTNAQELFRLNLP